MFAMSRWDAPAQIRNPSAGNQASAKEMVRHVQVHGRSVWRAAPRAGLVRVVPKFYETLSKENKTTVTFAHDPGVSVGRTFLSISAESPRTVYRTMSLAHEAALAAVSASL